MMSEELRAILAEQRTAIMQSMPVSVKERQDRLDRLIALLVENGQALVDAMSEDFGHRSPEQSWMTDIIPSIKAAKHAKKHIHKWMKAERRALEFPLGLLGARGMLEYQPKGVIGAIVPWNFPVQLTFTPLSGIFAAGNRCMVKASEFTPTTSECMAELAARYFARDELYIVNGGPDVGQAFSALPFDHIIFTGATSVGRHIMRAAADNLTPVTLELGGKSPVIVGKSADIAQAASRVAMGKTLNAGQICLAPDYAIVPKAYEDDYVDHFKRSVSAMYPTMLNNPDYTSIINDRHRDRLQSYLDDARDKGADVIEINPANEDFSSSNGRKMPTYLVRNATDDMKVMQEEIFGPILPIITRETVDEAIAYVNAHDRPLGLYYFGHEESEKRKVLDRTVSGGVTVNDVIFHVTSEDLPFGGVGPSGMGAYHGFDGFKTFSHAKSVYSQPKMNIAKLAGLLPPYGKTTHSTIKRDVKV